MLRDGTVQFSRKRSSSSLLEEGKAGEEKKTTTPTQQSSTQPPPPKRRVTTSPSRMKGAPLTYLVGSPLSDKVKPDRFMDENRKPSLFHVAPQTAINAGAGASTPYRPARVCSLHVRVFLEEAPPGNEYVLTRFPFIDVLRLPLTCPWCDEEMVTGLSSRPINIPPFCQLACRAIWQRIRNDEAVQDSSYSSPRSRAYASPVQIICSSKTLSATADVLLNQLSDEALTVLFVKHRQRVKTVVRKIASTSRAAPQVKDDQEEEDSDGEDEDRLQIVEEDLEE